MKKYWTTTLYFSLIALMSCSNGVKTVTEAVIRHKYSVRVEIDSANGQVLATTHPGAPHEVIQTPYIYEYEVESAGYIYWEAQNLQNIAGGSVSIRVYLDGNYQLGGIADGYYTLGRVTINGYLLDKAVEEFFFPGGEEEWWQFDKLDARGYPMIRSGEDIHKVYSPHPIPQSVMNLYEGDYFGG